MKKIGGKNGLSRILKTILLFFVALFFILLSFLIIKLLFSEGITEFFLSKSRIDLEITSISKVEEGVEIAIKRNPGKGDLVGIEFRLTDGIIEENFLRNTSMEEQNTSTFVLNYSEILRKVSIYPLLIKEESRVKGVLADEKEISGEEIILGISSLIFWCKFDNKLIDEIGGISGVSEGGDYLEGKKENSFDFDGSDNYIEFEIPELEDSLSVEFWYNRDVLDSSGSDGIVGNYEWNFFVSSRKGWLIKHPVNSNSAGFYLELSDGKDVKEFKVSSSPLDTKKWYHVFSVFDSTNNEIRIYINGKLENSEKIEEGYNKIVKSSYPLRIGYSPTNAYFDGKIDELRIYDSVISENKIRAIYNLY